jgi:hypothetical protein
VFARSIAAFALLVLAAGSENPVASEPPPGIRVQPAAQDSSATATARQAPARAPRIASYTIDASLDTATRTLEATQVLTWHNQTRNPATTLQFHLYYNAWRDAGSTWMRERSLAASVAARPDAWGSIEILRVQIGSAASPDRTSALRFIAPDDGNTEDRTVVELPLETPVQPGQSIDVHMAWRSRVPRTFARTGLAGRYYFIAQWFPKIGVLEEAGWNTHQFHATTEFFANFGSYDVRLTVPAGWLVGATGMPKGTRENKDGSATHHFYQEDVHDFAWTTSPDFVEFNETFTHPQLPPVALRLLLQPEHRGQESRHFEATRAALSRYGQWFGPYPYGHLTIVDPAWQSGTGGMEYPTLFTAGTRWRAPRDVAEPEDVILHEAAHQFWQGIVANNEFEHAWLDEGLAQYSSDRALAEVMTPHFWSERYFGGFVPWVFRDLPLARHSLARRGVLLLGGTDTPATPSWRYFPRTAAVTTYYRTSLWLSTLEGLVGWETLQRILSTYFSRWSFRHPSPADFFAVANEVSGRDLTWFFDQVHGSGRTFDYGVSSLRSERRSDASAARESEPGVDLYKTTVVVRRHAEGVFPVDVRLTLEDGEEVRWPWDGRDSWKVFEVERPRRARRADVDPGRVLQLDVRQTNNSAVLHPSGPRAARRWSAAWLVWLQDHLLTYGFLV